MNIKLKDLRELLANGNEEDDVSLGNYIVKEVPKFISSELPTQAPIKEEFAQSLHTCNLGDIMGALAACKRYYDVTKRKIIFLQRINMPASYYQGAVHGTVDENGTMVTLNKPLFDMVKPLLEAQEYIESMEIFNGQRVDLNFDTIRGKTFVNMPQGSLQAWLFYAFPDLAIDISEPWLFLPESKTQIEEVTKGKVIINFTERYRNGIMDYHFLKNYAPDLMFSGTEAEYFKFCNQWGLTIPKLEIKDFLELAYALRGCRFILSNQSFQWNLATGMGVSRVLEVCQYAHNCMPFYGKNNFGYFHQTGLEYYFRRLYNETA